MTRAGAIIALFLLPVLLQAGKTEKIMEEFRSVEEAIKNKKISPEVRLRTLEANLVRAMKLAIDRRFYYEKEKYLADLKPENISYENPTDQKTYYVKYKNFIARFDFARNPELLIQSPSYEKFLIVEEGTAHSSDN
jgi:hypothetical protein